MDTERLAAGGIVIDYGPPGPRVLLVHRPRYDDWSFPKGKLEEGETVEEAALREVREETGLECRIIRELAVARYNYQTRNKGLKPKAVHYFLMERLSDEVDRVEWLELDQAARRLSYVRDRGLLDLV